MSKGLISAFLFLLCTIITGNAFSQTTHLVQPKPPKSLNYSYKYTQNFFKAGESIAFLDDYVYPLKVKARQAGKNDVYIPLFDLERIYAPDFKATKDSGKFTVQHVGNTAKAAINEKAINVSGVDASLPVAPSLIDGEICVPVSAFMSTAFAKETKFQRGFVIVGHEQKLALPRNTRDLFGLMNHKLRGKKRGFVYRTYWFEEGRRTMTYRLYIPMTYDPKVPNKTILLAHGASVNQNYWFADTNDFIRYYKPMEYYAEKYGFMIVAPNQYIVGGSYGDTFNIPMMDWTRLNEQGELTDEDKKLRVLSEKGFMMGFDDALKHYNIDENNVILWGQSLGAIGALTMGNKYSERFKAIVITGGLPNLGLLNFNPYPNLANKPVFFAYGTEDFSGLDLAQKNISILGTYLNQLSVHWAAGGYHSDAWAKSMQQIFDFMNGT